VIVPVLNKRSDIVRTLQSISDSMAFFDANHPLAAEVQGEVIVVDEGSTDGTLELVQECARADFRLRLIQHHQSFGAGAARNTGVRMSRGDVLFYCDGDDLYFREHVFAGFSLLDHSESVASATAEDKHLRVGDLGHVVFSAKRPVAAVRTGVHLKETILPYWRTATGNSITQNLCVRRECHEWVEGFPEEAVYRRIGGCEDSAFSSWLATFFRVGQIDLETVEYVRRPGNSFDRQMKRFLHPPGSDFDVPSPALQALYDIRLRREDEKVGYLLDKWRVLGPPPLSPGLLNWELVLVELVRRRRLAEAVQVAEQASRLGQVLPTELTMEIRRLSQESVTRADALEP
jgi:glycosyltransferase involved in cell wall biosynthesis